MAKTLHRYRIWCVTENAYVYEWAETEPSDCPNNNGHTITSSLTSIIDTVSDAVAYSDISDLNSTTVTLGASGIYLGTAENVLEYNTISVNTYTDVASSINGLELQESPDGVNWDRVKKFSILDNTNVSHIINVIGKWFRIKYINGPTAQSSFRLQTMFRRFGVRDQTVSLIEGLNDDTDSLLTRSVIVGKTQGGQYDNVGLGNNSSIRTEIVGPVTSFGEVRIAELTPIIQVSFPYNINTNIVTPGTTGGGYAAASNSLIELGVTTSNSESEILSNKIAKYYPGQGTMFRCACFFDPGISGSEQLVGWGDDEDGYFIGYDGDQFGVLRKRGTVNYWTYRENFNLDPLDGSGKSGFNINPHKGNIYQIQIQWLGFGTITFSTETENGFLVPFHKINYPNNNIETSIINPSLPVRYYIKNTTNTTPLTLHVGSATVANEGRITVKGYGYYYSETDTNVNSTERILFSLRNRSLFHGKKNKNTILVRFIEGANDHAQQGFVSIYINTVLSGASWSDIDSNNSIAEIDTSASITTLGQLIGGALLGKTEAKSIYLDEVILNPGDIITITARESNGANGIMTGSVSWIEDIL